MSDNDPKKLDSQGNSEATTTNNTTSPNERPDEPYKWTRSDVQTPSPELSSRQQKERDEAAMAQIIDPLLTNVFNKIMARNQKEREEAAKSQSKLMDNEELFPHRPDEPTERAEPGKNDEVAKSQLKPMNDEGHEAQEISEKPIIASSSTPIQCESSQTNPEQGKIAKEMKDRQRAQENTDAESIVPVDTTDVVDLLASKNAVDMASPLPILDVTGTQKDGVLQASEIAKELAELRSAPEYSTVELKSPNAVDSNFEFDDDFVAAETKDTAENKVLDAVGDADRKREVKAVVDKLVNDVEKSIPKHRKPRQARWNFKKAAQMEAADLLSSMGEGSQDITGIIIPEKLYDPFVAHETQYRGTDASRKRKSFLVPNEGSLLLSPSQPKRAQSLSNQGGAEGIEELPDNGEASNVNKVSDSLEALESREASSIGEGSSNSAEYRSINRRGNPSELQSIVTPLRRQKMPHLVTPRQQKLKHLSVLQKSTTDEPGTIKCHVALSVLQKCLIAMEDTVFQNEIREIDQLKLFKNEATVPISTLTRSLHNVSVMAKRFTEGDSTIPLVTVSVALASAVLQLNMFDDYAKRVLEFNKSAARTNKMVSTSALKAAFNMAIVMVCEMYFAIRIRSLNLATPIDWSFATEGPLPDGESTVDCQQLFKGLYLFFKVIDFEDLATDLSSARFKSSKHKVSGNEVIVALKDFTEVACRHSVDPTKGDGLESLKLELNKVLSQMLSLLLFLEFGESDIYQAIKAEEEKSKGKMVNHDFLKKAAIYMVYMFSPSSAEEGPSGQTK
ncbi:hypothetical protein B9Z55_023873 [Caenorhabditis nigoni]|uniref:Uncharacterized protein n=1 Tax=Caenorhabditis nigoni TaxID=1611254 RepID=A0A2G5SSD5_9PELO|nr:hypothetical protein B9Z55_023873 [Caenorhabditis nigoni]